MQSKKGKKYTILVSGASGIVGYGILKSLRNSDCYLIGTTIYDSSPANCFSDIVEIVPRTSENNYISKLVELIKKYHVDMIIPGIEADMSMWNIHRKEIEQTGTFVLLNNSDLIFLCLDKWKFYKVLKERNFHNKIYTSISKDIKNFSFPLILKPRCGYGARGVVKIETEVEFLHYQKKIGETLIVQEYVGTNDEEYTVSAFFDLSYSLRAMMGMRRKLSCLGFTEFAEVVDSESFRPIIKTLANIFHPIGPTNFQFRKHGDEWKLLEINPRISSSASIREAFGYNESKMCIDYFLDGKEIEQPQIKFGKAIRYTEDYIFYDSDII